MCIRDRLYYDWFNITTWTSLLPLLLECQLIYTLNMLDLVSAKCREPDVSGHSTANYLSGSQSTACACTKLPPPPIQTHVAIFFNKKQFYEE